MKLMSWNVNGIRAAASKGFLDWLEDAAADVVCLQEIKCRPEQLDESLAHPKGYNSYWHPAEKPGYSGLVTYSKREPLEVRAGVGVPAFDREGRVLELEFRDLVVINTYFPNSQRDHARLPYKLEFCEYVLERLEDFRRLGKSVLICGDFNIAHKEIDLKNPKTNVKNAGFLPQEREWMDRFTEAGWIDAFRAFEKGPGHYTWWSQRPGCRAKNIGWRLDYFFVNPESADRLSRAWHEPHVTGSDHCPVGLDYDL